MKFRLEFNCDSDAFGMIGSPGFVDEANFVINRVAGAVYLGKESGPVFDSNGNRIGEFSIDED